MSENAHKYIQSEDGPLCVPVMEYGGAVYIIPGASTPSFRCLFYRHRDMVFSSARMPPMIVSPVIPLNFCEDVVRYRNRYYVWAGIVRVPAHGEIFISKKSGKPHRRMHSDSGDDFFENLPEDQKRRKILIPLIPISHPMNSSRNPQQEEGEQTMKEEQFTPEIKFFLDEIDREIDLIRRDASVLISKQQDAIGAKINEIQKTTGLVLCFPAYLSPEEYEKNLRDLDADPKLPESSILVLVDVYMRLHTLNVEGRKLTSKRDQNEKTLTDLTHVIKRRIVSTYLMENFNLETTFHTSMTQARESVGLE